MTQTPMQMKVPVLIQMMKPVLIQMMKWVPLIIMKELKILKGVPEKKGLLEIVPVPLNRTLLLSSLAIYLYLLLLQLPRQCYVLVMKVPLPNWEWQSTTSPEYLEMKDI
jgi:hypothetical protein